MFSANVDTTQPYDNSIVKGLAIRDSLRHRALSVTISLYRSTRATCAHDTACVRTANTQMVSIFCSNPHTPFHPEKPKL